MRAAFCLGKVDGTKNARVPATERTGFHWLECMQAPWTLHQDGVQG